MVRHDHNITEENLAREISNQQNNIVFQSADEAKTSE